MRKLIAILILFLWTSCEEDETIMPVRNMPVPVEPHESDTTGLSYLALGDSYTIGESVFPEEIWPEQLVDSLAKRNVALADPTVIARTGWRTDNLITAIANAEPANDFDIVSLLIGVNNQYQQKPVQQYKTEFEQLLKTAIELTKNKDPRRVFVLSIPDYGYTPFAKSNQKIISNELDEYNAINLQISSSYMVRYFNITDISRQDDPDLLAVDNLHPSAKQYSLWVARIMENTEFVSFLQRLE